jgi:hypothetical protein
METTQSQDVKEHVHEHLHYAAGDDRASFLFAGLLAAVRGFQGNKLYSNVSSEFSGDVTDRCTFVIHYGNTIPVIRV